MAKQASMFRMRRMIKYSTACIVLSCTIICWPTEDSGRTNGELQITGKHKLYKAPRSTEMSPKQESDSLSPSAKKAERKETFNRSVRLEETGKDMDQGESVKQKQAHVHELDDCAPTYTASNCNKIEVKCASNTRSARIMQQA